MALVHRALFTITVESGRTSTGSVQKVFSKHGHVDLLTVISRESSLSCTVRCLSVRLIVCAFQS